jgi:transposase InsO family protein
VLRTDTSTHHYKGRRGDQALLSKRIREIAQTRVRYGYRRIHVLLRREGWRVNAKRVYRLYREQGLQLRNMVPKRRVKVKLRPEYPAAYRILATTLGQLGHLEEARAALQRAMSISPALFDSFVSARPPHLSPEDYEHMLDGPRKAGWQG